MLPPVELPKNCFNHRRSKFIPERFYDDLLRNTFGNPRVKSNTVCIGIVNGSLYMGNAKLNFVFAHYYDASHSMIGIQDMRIPSGNDTIENMLYKLLKRAIGKTLYMYPLTEGTIMRSQIKSLKDLDNLPEHYANQIDSKNTP